MEKEQIKERISNALEAELSKIYDELGVNSGDISPLDLLEWEKSVAGATEIFIRLILQNTEK